MSTDNGIPTSLVETRPTGFVESGEQSAVLRDTLAAARVELGEYERQVIEWLSRWEWATVAVISSWVARAAAAREPAPNIALPSRFEATPAEIDQHLRRILAEDTYLRYQQAIGGLAVMEAANDARDRVDGADIPGSPVSSDYVKGHLASADHIDPAKDGGPYPSQLQCSQHDGFGPCPGAPRCTPGEAAADGEES
ncbi:hypothetical protein AB0D27_11310 [Streptomyces sp. NPDC048415]|uniref:hypothetical protein n=1 Tax=Streptomyces sp. NPDC048415 TaxID=3154822 RepID=UPI0034254B9A